MDILLDSNDELVCTDKFDQNSLGESEEPSPFRGIRSKLGQ